MVGKVVMVDARLLWVEDESGVLLIFEGRGPT